MPFVHRAGPAHRCREVKSDYSARSTNQTGFPQLPETATRGLPFRSAVVNPRVSQRSSDAAVVVTLAIRVTAPGRLVLCAARRRESDSGVVVMSHKRL